MDDISELQQIIRSNPMVTFWDPITGKYFRIPGEDIPKEVQRAREMLQEHQIEASRG